MSPVQTANAPLFTLRITDTRNGRSQSADVRHALTLIGTREGCWIRPRSGRLSPVHCAIVHTGDVIVARDLVSDAGTLVNESPIDVRVIRGTDRVTIGHWEFVADARGSSNQPPPDTSALAQEDAPAAPDLGDPNRWIAIIDANGETVFESDAPVVLAGSHVRCDVVLNDRQASSAHALIVRVDGLWTIADLLSSHGTRVNEQLVDKARRLNSDDTIQIGSSVHRVVLRAKPVASTSPPVAREDHQAMAREMHERGLVLDEREHTIAVLTEKLEADQAELGRSAEQLARQRDELAKRREELDAGLAALDSGAEELRCQSESMHTEQRQLREQREAQDLLRQAVQAECDALRSREQADRERSDSLDERAREVQQRETDLEHRKAWIDELGLKLQADDVALEQANEQLARDREALATQQRELDARSAALASREEETQRQCESLRVVQRRLQVEREALKAREEKLGEHERTIGALTEQLRLDRSDVDQDVARVARERDDLAKLQLELEARSSDIAVAEEQLKRQSESLRAERLQLEQQRETQETLRKNVHSEQQALGRWEEELRQKERMLTAAAEKLRAEFIALRQRARSPHGRAAESQSPEVGGKRHDDEGSSPRAALVDRDWLDFFSG